jgi:hypothetical protein
VLCSQKYDLNWGLQQLREVWTKNFKTSPAEEDDVEMTGDGEGLGESFADEDDFEKQMRLANESDKTAVRASPSQAQVDQLEGWLWKNKFRISRMTTSARKASLTIGMENCQGTLM